MRATENVTASGPASPMPDPHAAQNTPIWMEGPASAPPAVRRGHSPASSRSGLQTILFFGIIVVLVGAAGAFGVALWGPDKRVKNRTQFATNPPAPMELPSFASAAAGAKIPDERPAAPAEDHPAASAAPAASDPEAAAPAPSASAAAKKGKRAPRGTGKKAR